jgi:hypothetical protein
MSEVLIVSKERWISLAERVVPLLLTVGVPVAGGIWAVYVYTKNERDVVTKQTFEQGSQTRARLIELQKPFIEEQFSTYKVFTGVIGDLLVYTGDRPTWDARMFRYWQLHWGDVALVEDDAVHQAKLNFGGALKQYMAAGDDISYQKLQDASVVLTIAMRRGIQSSWIGELGVKIERP